MFNNRKTKSYVIGGTLALALLAVSQSASANGFNLLYSFSGGTDGGNPGSAALIMDVNGGLYGTTTLINQYNAGTVFRLDVNGTLTVLHSFSEGSNGFGPDGLVLDKKGNLWGSLCCGGNASWCGVIFRLTPDDHEKTIHTFLGSPDDGCGPGSPLAVAKGGNFFGTTTEGGENRDGTVFKLDPNGDEAVIHSFKGGRDGFYPFAGLIFDAQRNLYGTTDYGGRTSRCSNGFGGCGTIFRLSPNGAKTQLYKFKGPPGDGELPTDSLVMDASGDLYGTTNGGGRSGCLADGGCGTVFKLAPDGMETILHFFTGKHGDGENPVGGLVLDGAGNLYGATEYGGSGTCTLQPDYGCGTVFEIAPDGSETILYSFSKNNGANGAQPVAGLIIDGAGNLYGTASQDGQYGYGTVFEITP